jgi:hypothetical protein
VPWHRSHPGPRGRPGHGVQIAWWGGWGSWFLGENYDKMTITYGIWWCSGMCSGKWIDLIILQRPDIGSIE